MIFIRPHVLWMLACAIGAPAPTLAAASTDPRSAAGQDETTQDQKAADETKQVEAEQDDAKSLDELLELEEDESARSAEEASDRESADALDRALGAEEVSDAFREAIRQMSVSVSLLVEKFDAGLGTQRVQEEILRKLDDLIASAKKEKSDQPPSSSSSSSSQQQSRSQPRQQQPNDASQNPAEEGRNNNPADSSDANLPTERPDGDINSVLEETDVEWGALPARIRDLLMQARNDRPSALYRRLTQEYYRRLAEEASN